MTENGSADFDPAVTGAAAAASATPEPVVEACPPAEGVVIAPAELEALRAKALKADEHWERLLRNTAELDNFKKRAARDRQEAIKYANEGLLQKLIPALDNFEMALAATSNGTEATADSIKTGVTMILSQLRQALAEAGLEEVDAAGQAFNPAWHEAVSQQESTEVAEGHVLQQIRKGYKLRERLLRPAAVIVAKAPAPAGPASDQPAS
jgi:molecular chaperone GrpE